MKAMPTKEEQQGPFYSITIPTLNCSRSILKTLSSIHAQSLNDTEILIADGGSTDGTQTRAYKFFQEHNVNGRILSGVGNNIYQSLNQALRSATGRWIITLGSGDCFFNSNTLSTVKPILNRSKAGAVYGDTYVESTGETWSGPFNKRRILIENICHQSIFYRVSFLRDKQLYYNPSYSICADWDFNLKLYSISKMDHAKMYIARYEGNGLSAKNSSDPFRADRIRNIVKYYGIQAASLLPIHELTPNMASIPAWMHPLVWSKRIVFAPWRIMKNRCEF